MLFILRTLFITILAFLLLNPYAKSFVNTIEKPIVIVAKDNSKSVKEDINDKLHFLVENLDDFEVFTYSFSEKIIEGFSESNNGLKTNFSQFFSDLHNKFENRNIAGTIIASDGCYNVGLNPEYLLYDFPVYSIALGDTNKYIDVRVDNILKNDIAFYGNKFPLEISLASKVSKNEETKIEIFNNGIKVFEEDIILFNDIDYNSYTVYLPADKIGLQTYTIKVKALKNEKNISNNTLKTYIDILDTRSNILILKAINSPDVAAFKKALEKNQNYKIVVKDIVEDFLIEKYQLVVMFGIEKIPDIIKNNKIPIIIFNANQTHYTVFNSKIKFSKKGGLEEIDSFRNQSFSGFSFSSDLLKLIQDAPPLYTSFGKYNFQDNIELVLNQKIKAIETNNPVIMIQNFDSRKIAFIPVEGWWRWRLYDFSLNNNHLAFDELFSKITQYLILQEDKSLFRLQYEKQFEENNEIVFRASLYNESYELVNNKQVSLTLFDNDSKEYNFQFLNENNELIANLGVLDIGKYTFIAKVEGTSLEKKGVFNVKEIQLENIGETANHQVLNQIASKSGGKMFYESNVQSLIEMIKASERNKNIVHSKEKLEGFIDFSWILFLLLLLIFIEWLIRKYNGLI
ncbi:MAG: hypothetical protein CMD14_05740 [Flavobacteriales bacterium]|nr:hypothetical protein [Flavobacteriales bacterium]|tara:strand:+ start:7937 stop:9817 length:1881 start_codon:yes stop_codon:yes gene_type:complete